MDSKSRIVVRDGRLIISCRPVRPAAAAAKLANSVQPPRSEADDRATLWQGVGIALAYFNSDDSVVVSALTRKARIWADRYFKGYPYAANPPTAILRTFPNLFNLKVKGKTYLPPAQGFRLTQLAGPLRLTPAVMSPPSSPEPEGANAQELRRAERRSMNTESFPDFTEPTLAPEETMDELVHLKTRAATAAKPKMRVDAAMLRGSGLMGTLPEFLGQLARANIETETMLASNPDAVRFELDEDQAASQQHVEMSLFSGLMESQRRKHKPGILLPRGLAVESPASSEDDSSENEGSDRRSQSSSGEDEDSDSNGGTEGHSGETTEDENNGSDAETDVSTSTAASAPANLRKRKISALDDEDEDSGNDTDASTSTAASVQANLKKRKLSSPSPTHAPNKIRLQYHYPTPKIRYYDMQQRKLLVRPNPAAVPNDPFDALHKTPATKCTPEPAPEPETTRPTTSSSTSSYPSSYAGHPVPITKIRVPSRSPDGSRSTSPDRIIHLRHPVVPSSQTAREGSVASSGSSAGSSSGSGGRRIKIVVQKKEGGKRRKLIEEVE